MSSVIVRVSSQKPLTVVMGRANMINCGASKVENKGFNSTDIVNKG